MRKKERGAEDVQNFAGMPATTSITAAEIQQKEFRVSRFGGYRMRDVDEFLDQVTETMTKLSEDNQRLRSASGLPPAPDAPPVGAPDLADTSRQADEIIRRARAEADAILHEAGEKAAAMGATSTDAGRAAVAAFLSKEKDFLQQLASLVQGHAESVKTMAKAGRAGRRPEIPGGPEPAAPSTTPPAVAAAPAARPETPREPEAPQKPKPPEVREPPKKPKPPEVKEQASDPRPTEPIRLEEPASASVPAGESEEEGAAGERDRTLRELFWGED